MHFYDSVTLGKSVCAACIDDDEIRAWIEELNGDSGCEFYGQRDAPTADLGELAAFMRERMLLFYSLSIEHLMYSSADGGYQDSTWTTAEVLDEQIGLDFPRQQDQELLDELADAIEPTNPGANLTRPFSTRTKALLSTGNDFASSSNTSDAFSSMISAPIDRGGMTIIHHGRCSQAYILSSSNQILCT